jgi:hypothetical protein
MAPKLCHAQEKMAEDDEEQEDLSTWTALPNFKVRLLRQLMMSALRAFKRSKQRAGGDRVNLGDLKILLKSSI